MTVQVEICNKLGLHARPAMAFVDAASKFESSIKVHRLSPGDRPGSPTAVGVDGKSIMQMMMLAATKGTILEIVIEGSDAPQAAKELKMLVDSGFDEE